MRIVFTLLVGAALLAQPAPPRTIEFIFTSDAHYGLTRPAFRGGANVDAHVVNAAMVARMNALADPVDFIVEAGDIANREETTGSVTGGAIQPAAASWAQFKTDYIDGLALHDRAGAPVNDLHCAGQSRRIERRRLL